MPRGALRDIRSSYGLLGVICEVTFRIEPRVVFRHEYEVIPLNPLPTLATLRGGADAVLGFMQPYSKQILVERRFKDGNAAPSFWDHLRTKMRSVAWEHAATQLATLATSLPFAGAVAPQNSTR